MAAPARDPRAPIRILGAAALIASGSIHLDLYLSSYHLIPTIGPLFLMQTIVTFALGLALLITANEVLLLSGAALAAATLGGYLLSRWVGLFGFKEVPTTAGLAAGLLETFAILTLGYLGTRQRIDGKSVAPRLPVELTDALAGPLGKAGLPVVVLAALALSLFAGIGSTAPAGNLGTLPTNTSAVRVTISNFTFVPAKITVEPGVLVVVKNEDSVAHTLTAIPASSPFGDFNTGNINPGQSKSFRAPEHAGSYSYYCSIHNFMTGTLVVR